jgi:hypothetical protein
MQFDDAGGFQSQTRRRDIADHEPDTRHHPQPRLAAPTRVLLST